MRRFVFWSAALILLAFIGRGQGGPVHSLDAVKHHVDPLGQRQFTVSFVGQKPARAIVIGSGATYMALYVYDQFGNCVARDEPLGFLTRDDLAAEWLPPETAPYTVELRNLGIRVNQFEMKLK